MAENKTAPAAADTKAAVVKEPTLVEKAIANIKLSAPHVKYAWINEAGEYHFHKRPGFSKYNVQVITETEDDEPVVNEPGAAGKANDNLEF